MIPNGNHVISASYDNTLKIWNLKTGMEVHTLTGHSNRINGLSVTPDGNHAVSVSFDNMLKVWDLKTGKEVSAFAGDGPFRSVVFSSDGIVIVAGEISGRMHFLQFER